MKSTGDVIESPREISVGKLWLVHGILMVLLLATVLVSFFHMGHFNIIVAGLIAFSKAGLVMWFFMHFRQAQRLVGLLFAGSLFILIIAGILSFADYLTR